jgi:phosphatidylserine/phosphatidylglycerophosphate/cardiolipin synthase-like enzyme
MKWISLNLFLFLMVSCSNLKQDHEIARSIASEEEYRTLEKLQTIFKRKEGLFINSEEAKAYELIEKADKSIDIEIYEMKDPKFRKLVLEALDRGVKVRIIKDPGTVGESCDELKIEKEDDDTEQCTLDKNFVKTLKAKGGEYVYFNKKNLCGIKGTHCFEHGKMIITDKRNVLLSTGNFNSSSLCNSEEKLDKCNRDYSFVIRDRGAVKLLRDVFENDFKGEDYDLKELINDHNESRVTISPFSLEPIVEAIKSAKKEIWIQNQYLEEETWNEELIQASNRGVKVNLMVADFCTYGSITESKKKKILEIYSKFQSAGIKAKAFTNKIKINKEPGYLHSKALLLDEETGWIGSVNGSSTSTSNNREFGVFFRNNKSIEKLKSQMVQDFNHPRAIAWQDSLECKK